jgi:uncharacterized membrane protein YbhN (UPF0104 family)
MRDGVVVVVIASSYYLLYTGAMPYDLTRLLCMCVSLLVVILSLLQIVIMYLTQDKTTSEPRFYTELRALQTSRL